MAAFEQFIRDRKMSMDVIGIAPRSEKGRSFSNCGEIAWYLTSVDRVTADTAAKIREIPNVIGGADAFQP